MLQHHRTLRFSQVPTCDHTAQTWSQAGHASLGRYLFLNLPCRTLVSLCMENQGLCSRCVQRYVQGTWHQTFNDYRIPNRPEVEALTPVELCPECPHRAAGPKQSRLSSWLSGCEQWLRVGRDHAQEPRARNKVVEEGSTDVVRRVRHQSQTRGSELDPLGG